MTQIYPMNDTSAPGAAGLNQTAQKRSGDAFEAALNKAVAKTGETENTQSQETVSGLQEIASRAIEIQSTTDIVSKKTDQLLDVLDKFSYQLGDPAVSLKKIAPVLEQMQQDAGELIAQTQQLAAQDGPLKEIANQAALTAQAEVLKFQRGDYAS